MDKFKIKAINEKLPRKIKLLSVKKEKFISEMIKYDIEVKIKDERHTRIYSKYTKNNDYPIEKIINDIKRSFTYKDLYKTKKILLKRKIRK